MNDEADRSAKGPRLRRPDLPRRAPLRDPASLLRAAAAGGQRMAHAEADATSPDDPLAAADTPDADRRDESAVERGVRIGYQVIEEQIDQGRKLAARLGRATRRATAASGVFGPDPAGGAGDAQADRGGAPTDAGESAASAAGESFEAWTARVLDLYRDLGELCFDAAERLARSPLMRAASQAAANAASASTPGSTPGPASAANPARPAASAAAAAAFELEIESRHRIRVAVELSARPLRGLPRVAALHPAEPGPAPLTGVGIEASAARPLLRIAIPIEQAPGAYHGVILDGDQACGTLTIRLF